MSIPDDAPPEARLCHLDYLRINLGRSEAAVQRLVALFLMNYGELLQRVRDTAAAAELPALQSAVHDLRSNCVLFSAERCIQQARKIETALRDALSEGGAHDALDWVAEAEVLCCCVETMSQELRRYQADNPA